MSISSPGVGSGLDINSIVTQLVAVEKQPLVSLQTKASKLQTQLSSFGTVKSQLASLQDASSALLSTENWGAKTFSSSSSTTVTGSASSSAIASSFSMDVTSLAASQSARTDAITSTDTVGSNGSLSISIGKWTTEGGVSAFEPNDSDEDVEVTISSSYTLSDVANAINSADGGVTAVVVTSGTQQKLLIRSSDTGEDYGFQIKALDENGAVTTSASNGLVKFSYNPEGAGTGLELTQEGQDASILIEDIEITSSTNTIKDALPGVTLNLLSTASDVKITVGNDTATIKTKITAFQDAYNTLVGNLKSLTKYDATTKTAGALQGDGTAVTLLSVLRSMITAEGPTATSATFGYLSDVGLQVQESGLLTTNGSKLTSALDSLSDLKTFFSNYGGSTATNGLAMRFRDFAWAANGIEGTISLKNTALAAAISRNSSDQEKFNIRIAEVQKRLYKQYGGLDSKMGGLNGLSSFVSSQVAQWNKR